MMIWIGLGGAVGAVSRYSLGVWIGQKAGSAFPWATLLVNLAGSILLGLLAGAEDYVPQVVTAMLGTGFCGAFTTFSTFGYETITMLQNKRYVQGVSYVISSVILGLAGAWAGYQFIHIVQVSHI